MLFKLGSLTVAVVKLAGRAVDAPELEDVPLEDAEDVDEDLQPARSRARRMAELSVGRSVRRVTGSLLNRGLGADIWLVLNCHIFR
jgi:hypothetical protein